MKLIIPILALALCLCVVAPLCGAYDDHVNKYVDYNPAIHDVKPASAYGYAWHGQ